MDEPNVVCKCGSDHFIESTRCNGWWIVIMDGNGSVWDTNLDKLNHGTIPKTVKCADCGRVNPNPMHLMYGETE